MEINGYLIHYWDYMKVDFGFYVPIAKRLSAGNDVMRYLGSSGCMNSMSEPLICAYV